MRLNGGVAAGTEATNAFSDIEFPIILAPDRVRRPAEAQPEDALPALAESSVAWDAGL